LLKLFFHLKKENKSFFISPTKIRINKKINVKAGALL